MSKYLLLVLMIALVAATLSGCYITQALKVGVDKYCAMADTYERSIIRERVNSAIAPNIIQVNCY
jgi:general stress protein CsbA